MTAPTHAAATDIDVDSGGVEHDALDDAKHQALVAAKTLARPEV